MVKKTTANKQTEFIHYGTSENCCFFSLFFVLFCFYFWFWHCEESSFDKINNKTKQITTKNLELNSTHQCCWKSVGHSYCWEFLASPSACKVLIFIMSLGSFSLSLSSQSSTYLCPNSHPVSEVAKLSFTWVSVSPPQLYVNESSSSISTHFLQCFPKQRAKYLGRELAPSLEQRRKYSHHGFYIDFK